MKAALGILLILLASLAARADILPSAAAIGSIESHGWVAIPVAEPKGAGMIVHLPPRHSAGRTDGAADAQEGSIRLALRLPRMPERLAAWGNQLWMAFPPDGGQRRVLSMGVERGPIAGAWSSEDAEGRLPALASLPGDKDLIGFAGTPGGPLALMRGNDGLSLLAISRGEWRPVELPTGLGSATDRQHFLAPTEAGPAIVEFGPQRAVLWKATRPDLKGPGPDAAGGPWTWEQSPLSMRTSNGAPAPAPWGQVALVGGQVVYLSRSADSAAELWNPAPTVCLPLARRPGVGPDVAMLPIDDRGRVALVWQERIAAASDPAKRATELETHVVELSALTGATLYDGPARVGGPVSAAELKLLALALSGVMAVVLLAVLRPDRDSAPLSLPQGLALAEPGRRIAAAAIDLLIAMIGVGWFRGIPVGEMLLPATLLYDPIGIETLLLVLGTGAAHCTLGEWLLGCSIGKLLARCEVVHVSIRTVGGAVEVGFQRPAFWRAAARNVVRWALPPLAIMGMNGPDRRHRGDLAGGTVVVVRTSPD